MNPTIQFVATRGLTAAMTASGTGLLVNGWMMLSARKRMVRDPGQIPDCDTAIVPGAKVYPDGTPSPVLEDRLQAGWQLFQAGKVNNILVSGDANAREFNEPEAMGRWLVDRGVPQDCITRDPGGHRTRATMQRAREVFAVRRAVVCTQAFHLARSLYLAHRAGIRAWGLVADRRIYQKRHRDKLREFFARQVAFLESTLFA